MAVRAATWDLGDLQLATLKSPYSGIVAMRSLVRCLPQPTLEQAREISPYPLLGPSRQTCYTNHQCDSTTCPNSSVLQQSVAPPGVGATRHALKFDNPNLPHAWPMPVAGLPKKGAREKEVLMSISTTCQPVATSSEPPKHGSTPQKGSSSRNCFWSRHWFQQLP